MPTSSCSRQLLRRSPAALGVLALLPALAGAATLHVNVSGGADGPACGSDVSPCASIQQAVDLAGDGDTILVAQGTYLDDELCATGSPPGLPTVVCIQKDVTILGGFNPPIDGWSVPDSVTNATVIDGQGVRRGVILNRPEGGLRMEGFTIRNAVAQNDGTEFGGGMWAVLAGRGLTLRDMEFLDNRAEAGLGMQAGGGGLAIQGNAANIVEASLERVKFERNEARGGGVTLTGSGLGGGLHADHANVTILDLQLIDNMAIGGDNGDGLGGGASFSFGTFAVLEDVLATGNVALGGVDRSGFGGALYAEGDPANPDESTEMSLVDAVLRNNEAQCGGGAPPASAGGGFLAFNASATLNGVTVIFNAASAGTGSAGGGGLFFWAPTPGEEPSFTVRNSIVAKNELTGTQGGGSGIRLLGATATISHTTVAENRLNGIGLGSGILAGPAPSKSSHLDLEYSIVAGHDTGDAVFLQTIAPISATGTFRRNHFAGNVSDRCDPAGPLCSSAYNNYPGDNIFDGPGAVGFFVDPLAGDFHVDGTMPPVDMATGSTEIRDIDGALRSGSRDIGADQFGATAYRLTVRKTGTGNGTVTSSIPGINCGVDCTELYADSEVVVLSAVPDPGSVFAGFGGDSDCADGSVLMSVERQCDAPFPAPPHGNIVVEKQTVPDGRSEQFLFWGAATANLSDGQEFLRSVVAPGTYLVMETDHPLFHLDSIACDDGVSATPSSGDLATLTATFRVDPGETVRCTFTNSLTTCSATDQDLVLPDEVVNDTRTIRACDSIQGGPYTVGPTGNVSMEAPTVVLHNDFTVLADLTITSNVP